MSNDLLARWSKDGIQTSVIHSEEEFLRVFKKGDTVFTIDTVCEKPVGYSKYLIEEIISKYESNFKRVMDTVKCLCYTSLTGTETFPCERYVADMVNLFHGVCRDEDDIKEYFQVRLGLFNGDFKLQERHMKLQEQWSKDYDEWNKYYDDSDY